MQSTERMRAVRKNAETKQNVFAKLYYLHMLRGSPLVPIFGAEPPQFYLCCPRPRSHRSSNNLCLPHARTQLTSVIKTHLAIRTDPFSLFVQTIPILSDKLYSITLFLFQLFYAPVNSQLYPFATISQNFSNTSSQEQSLSFSP